MKNNKEKKTKLDLDRLILSLNNNTITQSNRNKIEFKLGGLFVYLLMIKINKKKISDDVNKIKNKLTRKSICIYMAENIKEFRMLYLYYVKKKYPQIKKRKKIGLDFYNNIVIEKSRNWEATFVFKKLVKHCRDIYTIEDIDKKKYKINK
jgi:hypothetical protein|tara:strand:- start:352 stop:801 length:450 start_codon:yes stop_codon:yes gene_type:complete